MSEMYFALFQTFLCVKKIYLPLVNVSKYNEVYYYVLNIIIEAKTKDNRGMVETSDGAI